MGVCGSADDTQMPLTRVTSKEKRGKMIQSHFWGNFGGVEAALKATFEERGGPVYLSEVHEKFCQTSYYPVKHKLLTRNVLFDIYCDDKVLANNDVTLFSLDPKDQSTPENPTQFKLYSDRFADQADHLTIRPGKALKLYPKPETPTTNLEELRELLLSKDLSRNEELSWIDGKNYRFLDGKNIDGWHTGFTSFPRSGNSMLRRHLENLTGVISGSDVDLFLTVDLQSTSLYGESHVGSEENLTWITKGHYPIWIFGTEPKFVSNKQICLVRNPIDNFVSYSLLASTITHSLQTKTPQYQEYPEDWDTVVKWLTEMYENYIKMEREQIQDKCPTLYLRYEDLCQRPEENLTMIFKFLLNVESLEGTVIEHRIAELAAKGASKSGSVYTLKKQDYTKLLRQEKAYTPEQIEHIKTNMREALLFFGYTNDPNDPEAEQETGFLPLASFKDGDADNYRKFERHNQEMMKKLGTPELAGGKAFTVNADRPLNSMFLPICDLQMSKVQPMR